MIINSFAEIEGKLTPIEVELLLLPGLPQIHFLGLPDQGIKELDRKIRMALRKQGFDFPRAQQVIVNLRPTHLKKKSRGLDLAVAVALLIETGQVPNLTWSPKMYAYGQLGLDGRVEVPSDLQLIDLNGEECVLSGEISEGFSFKIQQLTDLKSLLQDPKIILSDESKITPQRPRFGLNQFFDPLEVQLILLIVLGGHSCMMAGPPGVGKTTLAKSIASFLPEPKNKIWHPIVIPHHTNTVTSLLGGGVPLQAGDITRAHEGVLVMDEFLEFDPKIQEALREPLEEGVLRLGRKNSIQEFLCEFLILATTNLCPCGKWLPEKDYDCLRSRVRCQSYRQKLSGPVLDRFDMLYFKQKSSLEKVSGLEVLTRIESFRSHEIFSDSKAFYQNKLRQCQVMLKVPTFVTDIMDSQRRLNSTRRVAISLAKLEGILEPKLDHWRCALEFTYWPFQKINQDLVG